MSTTSTLTRTTITKTVSNAAAAYKSFYLSAAPTSAGVAIDATFRVCAPMDEHGPTANAWIPTSGSAVTINDPAGYDWSLVYFPTRTNLLLQSANLTAGAWVAGSGDTVAASPLSAPVPGATPYRYTEGGSTVGHRIATASTTTLATSSPYELSAYYQPGSHHYIRVSAGDTSGNSVADIVDTTTNTTAACGVVAGSGMSATCAQPVSIGGGWYRAPMRLTTSTTTSYTIVVGHTASASLTSASASYAGTPGDYTDFAGPQLEAISSPASFIGYPSPYIATTTAAASANDMRITDLGFDKEGAATNLVLYSQGNFSNAAAWTIPTGTTVTDNAAVAPDGTTTASLINDGTSASVSHGFGSATAVSVTSGNVYSTSIFGKAGTNAFVQLTLAAGQFSGLGYANINLQNCTVAQTGGTLVASGAWLYANGQCRGWIAQTATATGSINPGPIIVESGTAARNPTFTGTGLTEYLWGYQVEQGTIPSSYCPSGSATCTRAADVAYINGLPTLPAYTLAFKGLPRAISASVPQYLGMYDGGSDASRAYLAVSNTQHQAQLLSSGTNVYAGTTTGTTQAGVAGKVVASYAPGFQSMAAAGMLGTTGTGPAAILPGGFNRLDLGDNIGLTRPLNGYIQTFELDPYATPPAKEPGKTLH